MSKIIVTPSSLDHMYELTSYNIDGFIIPIKNLSANQSFEVDYKDLELVIDKIKNKEVILLINKMMHSSDIELLRKVLKKTSTLKVDKIMYYDNSVYMLSQELKLNIPLVIYQDHLNLSILSNKFYNDMGINYAYISSDITKEEIRDIKLNTKSKLFITAYGYVPIFYSRRYLLSNYFEYIDKSYKKDVFYLDNEYPIKESDFGTIIYSNKIINLINELDKLDFIDYIVMDSFNIDRQEFNEMVNKFINKDKVEDTYTGFLDKKTICKVKNSNEGGTHE